MLKTVIRTVGLLLALGLLALPGLALAAPRGTPAPSSGAVGTRLMIAGAAATSEQCFAETDRCVEGRFLDYWQAHGGLEVNGYPISNPFVQQLEDGNWYTVQYFERVRLELHPENDAPYDVLLGQFGRRLHPADPPAERRAVPHTIYFPETGHNLGGRFRAHWAANGDLAQFGYPLTEEIRETIDGREYLVQYFERARFEYHPEHDGTPYEVLLGQFGRQIFAELSDR